VQRAAFSDNIPASATAVMSTSGCAAMNAVNVDTKVTVSALFPSNAAESN
jgi:hypothetical protein